jgi:hypothetical protein
MHLEEGGEAASSASDQQGIKKSVGMSDEGFTAFSASGESFPKNFSKNGAFWGGFGGF